MKKKLPGKKIREIFILVFLVPLVFFLLIEGTLRLFNVNTEIVKSDKFKIGIPLWAHNEANFAIASDIYQQILDTELPVDSAEWMRYFIEAKHVHYKMKPNISVKVTNTINKAELKKGIKILLKSNSEGFRSNNLPRKKAKHVFRIAFLGDSTTFGWGVDQNQRFSDLLEKKLNQVQDKIKFETINLGIPGYSSYHGVALFDHYALKYSPDMVILSFGANDSRKIPKNVKKLLLHPGWIEKTKTFLRNFKTYRLLRKFLLSLYNPFDNMNKKKAGTEPKESFVTLKEFTKNLEYIIDKGKKRGIQTVLLSLCCPLNYLAKTSAVGKRKKVPALDGMYIMLKNLQSIQNNETYKSLAAYYRQLYGEQVLKDHRVLYVTSDTCHPNIIGHQIIAKALYEKIFKNKITP